MGNLVLRRIDYDFIKLARRHNLTYTHNIDDIPVSGSVKLNDFVKTFSDFVTEAGFRLSQNKTHFRYRHEPQVVTGLLVNDKLRPTTKYLFELRRTTRCCWPGAVGASI
jgi:hypothetical protein